MASRDSSDELVGWAPGDQPSHLPSVPKFLYMHIKQGNYVASDWRWYPRPAHLIICKNTIWACVREYTEWPRLVMHQREFGLDEAEEAKAWCEIVWRMGK